MTPTVEEPPRRVYHFIVNTADGSARFQVEAEIICQTAEGVTLKKGGQKVGEIAGTVLAWWVEERSPSDSD